MLPKHITNNNPLQRKTHYILQKTTHYKEQITTNYKYKYKYKKKKKKKYNYKQHITHKHYKSGMCIYIYQMKT